ncbi:MAG TPA: condensation domain-containing protein, partial [Streptosporangiaceae bacterium]
MSRARIEDVWPLSPLAEGLLFHADFADQGPDVYVSHRVLDVSGPVDPERLKASWEVLLARHAVLRASFQRRKSGAPMQVIARRVALPWRVEDLSGLDPDEAEKRAEELADAARAQRFDLGVPPLLRLVLIKLAEDRHRLVVTSHHILIDGWSMPVLMGELAAV